MAAGAGLSGTGPLAPAAGRPPAGRPAVAAFDFDGTLVPGDSLLPFLLSLLGRHRLAAAARAAVPMAAGYRRGGRSGAKEALLARTVAGMDAARVAAAGESFGAALASRLRPALGERLDWHRASGHRVVVVSASLSAYLRPFAERVGAELVCTQLEEGPDGRLTGRLLGANVRGAEKVTRLTEHLGLEPGGLPAVELWAYGDSPGDRELLAAADHPTWVGRSARLSP